MKCNKIGSAVLALLTIPALFVFASSRTSAQPNAASPAQDAARGKAAFLSYGCYECHGTVAQGNYMGIPHLAPHPLPYSALSAYVRRPAGQMPSYSIAVLPDTDLASIYAYLRSISVGKAASQIQALSHTQLQPK